MSGTRVYRCVGRNSVRAMLKSVALSSLRNVRTPQVPRSISLPVAGSLRIKTWSSEQFSNSTPESCQSSLEKVSAHDTFNERPQYWRGREKHAGAFFNKYICLPWWCSLQQLRIILGLDYSRCLKLCGVHSSVDSYHWKDNFNREFATRNKREIMVPYPSAAYACNAMGLIPQYLEFEPYWDRFSLEKPTSGPRSKLPTAAVAILGAPQHGRTALFEALSDLSISVGNEGIDRETVRYLVAEHYCESLEEQVHDMTAQMECSMSTKKHSCNTGGSENPLSRANARSPTEDSFPICRDFTLMHAPGNETYRGSRQMLGHVADIILFVISKENGLDSEVISHLSAATKLNLPITFVLTKSGSSELHLCQELEKQCALICEENGLPENHFRANARNAVCLPSISVEGLQKVLKNLHANLLPKVHLGTRPITPFHTLEASALEETEYNNVQKFVPCKRRLSNLVDAHITPVGVAVVMDISKSSVRGTTLIVMVRHGSVTAGTYFVAGSCFGRVNQMWSARTQFRQQSKMGEAGECLQISGLIPRTELPEVGDTFLVLPRDRAYRVAEYRKELLKLAECQVSGIPLTLAWQRDNISQNYYENNITPDQASTAKPVSAKTSKQAMAIARSSTTDVQHKADERESVLVTPDSNSVENFLHPGGPKPDSPVLHTKHAHQKEQLPIVPGGRKSARKNQRRSEDEHSDPEVDPNLVYGFADWRDPIREKNEELMSRWQQRQEEQAAEVSSTSFGRKHSKSKEDALEDQEDSVAPIVPVICRAPSATVFEALYDEMLKFQEISGTRISLVHGGLGPVTPSDIAHCEVENITHYCPVYALNVAVLPQTVRAALAKKVEVKRFSSYLDVLNDIKEREGKIRRIRQGRIRS